MPNLGPNFYPKLVKISSELGMKPEDILAIMVSESGVNPQIPNQAGSHAIGLIQFTQETLKQLGFNKDWREFGNVNGEQQLDYVKQYIANQMKFNGGKPFDAATFYVATYWPVALRLPGVQAGDPSAAITEEHPATVTDRKTGKKYSKKYYDIGIRIDPGFESRAYTSNPLFHGPTPGVITLGDMQRQVNKIKRGPIYRNAVAQLHNQQPMPVEESKPESSSFLSSFLRKMEGLLSKFIFASQQNNYLITVGSSSNYYTTMEYARILSAALEEYLNAKINICANDSNVEIECKIAGDKNIVFNAIKELSVGVSDAFQHATRKMGSISTFALVTADLKSDYESLHPKRADLCYRSFRLNFERSK